MEHIHIPLILDVNKCTFGELLELWPTSGEFFQRQWNNVLEFTGDSPVTLYVFGTFVLTTIEYWTLCALYFFLDTSNRCAFIRERYKIMKDPQPESPYKDKKRLFKVAKNVLINQSLISIPVGFLTLFLADYRGFMPVRELPSAFRIIGDLSILIACEEVGFYYVHRTLHHRSFYHRFHKTHHEWRVPIAMAAIYCHPVEHLFCNLLPIFGGFLLCGSHVVTCWIWIASVYFVVLYDHSGYHFPFFMSSEAHDFHHKKSTTFFGVFGFLDWVHQTDGVWRQSSLFPRHKILWTTKGLQRKK